MKKIAYVAPSLDVVRFESEDVMANSLTGNGFLDDIDWDGASDTDDKQWGNWSV